MTRDIVPPPHAIDIGCGHKIEFVDYLGEVAGINDWHLTKCGAWCRGWVSFNGSAWRRGFRSGDGWNVVQRDPLTLSPSLLCRACGDHGHIVNGKWVPC